jgi:hypothetical protein
MAVSSITTGAPARLPHTHSTISRANGIVVKAAIRALDDEDAAAAALYLAAAKLFRQAGDYDRATETYRLAADCLCVVAEAA